MINPRIITGEYKGKKVEVPEGVRPLTDRVKKNIFDIISDLVEGVNVLDLFAGSGNFGLEALSQGANFVTFVDKSENSIRSIRKNLLSFHTTNDKYEVINRDYVKFLNQEIARKYQIIFVDPPFKITIGLKLHNLHKIIAQDGILIMKIPAEEIKNFTPPKNFHILRENKLGINYLYFLQCLPDNAEHL